MTQNKLRTIGRILKEEEARFIGYPEIEKKSRDLGFGMTVRTLRFYVDEGILPPPKKVGKTPVYEEEWILNVLLAIHLMKTRFARALTDIRAVLGLLQEDPAHLADKLSVLYEECSKDGALKPIERQALIDAFFDLLTGRLGVTPQPSQVRLCDLVDAIRTKGRWDGEAWSPPPRAAILASQAQDGGEQQVSVSAPGPEPASPAPPPRPTALQPPLQAPVIVARPVVAREAPPPAPEGAVSVERARALEEMFIGRFEQGFERLGRVHCPLDGKGYKSGPRERSLLKRDRAGEIVDVMKRHRVFDRALLDLIPLDETREFQVFQRGLFGRGDLKVVVSALSLSPLEAFVRQRWADDPLGPLEVERALDALPLRDDVFHYVGMLSTVGWSRDARARVPVRRNLLVCLVESAGSSAWRRHLVADPRWGGVERVFDPETDREKVDRARDAMREHLKPKGEFLILNNLVEDLDLPPECIRAALDELLAEDGELQVQVSGGREIVKRRRL
ncbi:MAG: helix-turn-helix domain-containing protein [Planctomycetes bacterium]|nr:helix-turn-helix domain-containing protein [Planctomycetota bacterium]